MQINIAHPYGTEDCSSHADDLPAMERVKKVVSVRLCKCTRTACWRNRLSADCLSPVPLQLLAERNKLYGDT